MHTNGGGKYMHTTGGGQCVPMITLCGLSSNALLERKTVVFAFKSYKIGFSSKTPPNLTLIKMVTTNFLEWSNSGRGGGKNVVTNMFSQNGPIQLENYLAYPAYTSSELCKSILTGPPKKLQASRWQIGHKADMKRRREIQFNLMECKWENNGKLTRTFWDVGTLRIW